MSKNIDPKSTVDVFIGTTAVKGFESEQEPKLFNKLFNLLIPASSFKITNFTGYQMIVTVTQIVPRTRIMTRKRKAASLSVGAVASLNGPEVSTEYVVRPNDEETLVFKEKMKPNSSSLIHASGKCNITVQCKLKDGTVETVKQKCKRVNGMDYFLQPDIVPDEISSSHYNYSCSQSQASEFDFDLNIDSDGGKNRDENISVHDAKCHVDEDGTVFYDIDNDE